MTSSVSVTRVADEIYWAVAEAVGLAGSMRRQNLVLRRRVPSMAGMTPVGVRGDVVVSDRFQLYRDSTPGCFGSAADLLMEAAGQLTSGSGPLPRLNVERSLDPLDTSWTSMTGGLNVSALLVTADVEIAPGATRDAPGGVVHALGDLTLTGGSAAGILIIDGTLTIAGPLSYSGIIIARGGVKTTAPGAQITGIMRVGAPLLGGSPALHLTDEISIQGSSCAAQAVLASLLIPLPVAGRRWAEMF